MHICSYDDRCGSIPRYPQIFNKNGVWWKCERNTEEFSEENDDEQVEDDLEIMESGSIRLLSLLSTERHEGQQKLAGGKDNKKAQKSGTNTSKKRGVTISTVEKWKRDYDKCLQTSVWLDYEKMDQEFVLSLKCKVCCKFEDKIQSVRNFNCAFINGSKNLSSSAMKDHGKNDMHQTAMRLYNKHKAKSITEYSPLARAFSSLDPNTKRDLDSLFHLQGKSCFHQNGPTVWTTGKTWCTIRYRV